MANTGHPILTVARKKAQIYEDLAIRANRQKIQTAGVDVPRIHVQVWRGSSFS